MVFDLKKKGRLISVYFKNNLKNCKNLKNYTKARKGHDKHKISKFVYYY